MDNFKTHDASAFYETFLPEGAKPSRDRFEFIFTLKHGSWLNMAEIALPMFNGQCLNRGISTKEKITTEVEAWRNHLFPVRSRPISIAHAHATEPESGYFQPAVA